MRHSVLILKNSIWTKVAKGTFLRPIIFFHDLMPAELVEFHVHFAHIRDRAVEGICQSWVHVLLALDGTEHHGVVRLPKAAVERPTC